MKIIDCRKIDFDRHERVTFIRVEPENIHTTLEDILRVLCDLSWIGQFDNTYLKNCFEKRCNRTVKYFVHNIEAGSDDKVTGNVGEYVVSEIAREAIISELKYKDIPLAELFKKKKIGNAGFDFYTENELETLIFGEAKFLTGKNAYGKGCKSVCKFVTEYNDVEDLENINAFFSPETLEKVNKGIKGFSIGFSSKNTSSDNLIEGILKNTHYSKLLDYEEIILVAVDVA